MRGAIRIVVALLVACTQSTAQSDPTLASNGSSTKTASDTVPPPQTILNGSDPGPAPLLPEKTTKKKEVRAFHQRARKRGGELFGDRPAPKGSSFRSRTANLRAATGTHGGGASGEATSSSTSKGASKGQVSASKGPPPPPPNAGGTDNSDEGRSAIPESACAEVANATFVSDRTNVVISTYRMEMHVIASTNQARLMRWRLGRALQQTVAPDLTACADAGETNATRVRHRRQRQRQRQRQRRALLQSGVLNVVFGPLQVKEMRECPDPSGARGQASCFRTVGNVSVYRQGGSSTSGGGDASFTGDDAFAAALENRTEALSGVYGLIDVFSCTVTRLWNATDPVPEGSGRTNQTSQPSPGMESDNQSRGASVSGLSASAGVGIAMVVIILVLVGLFVVRHRRRQPRQHPFAPMKDGEASSEDSTGYDSMDDTKLVPAASMKILGPARDDVDAAATVSGTVEVGHGADPIVTDTNDPHETPTVEERLIDNDDEAEDGPNDDDTRDVEITPVFRLVSAIDINPPEDDQTLMSMERERRHYE